MTITEARFDESIEKAISDIGIPPRPAILQQINEEILSEEPDFQKLAKLIGSDVALSAGVLKVANSPWFGRCAQAKTVNEAIMTLGLEMVAGTIGGMVLRRAFPGTTKLNRFWDASVQIARLSAWLCQHLKSVTTVTYSDAYTFGLFRDCGIAIMLTRTADYAATLSLANAEARRKFTDIEDERHPCNHAQVGSLLARSWCLPEEACIAIHRHHDLSELVEAPSKEVPEASVLLIAIAQLAEYQFQRISGLSAGHEWDKLGDACKSVLAIDDEQIANLTELAKDTSDD